MFKQSSLLEGLDSSVNENNEAGGGKVAQSRGQNGVRNRNSEQQNRDSFSNKNFCKAQQLEQDVFDKAQVAEQVVNANNNEERRRKQKAMGSWVTRALTVVWVTFLGLQLRRIAYRCVITDLL